MSPQNIYDDPDFLAGYSRLPRSELGLGAVFEWPAFQRLPPHSLCDRRVLDLGCGLGYFAREARARGAREVVGVATRASGARTLLESGRALRRLEEPEAEAPQLAEKPEWREERRRPPFLLLAVDRPS